MLSTEKDIYRLVPYRFFLNEADTDACKLEKLTNLFPDMKAIIELELFKFNNLSRMLDRLSRVYSVSTAIDTRDDTYHVFLGPYHLSLGPAIFGALHFKNISTALLTQSNAHNQQTRRHGAILRRFRRAVRKLILIRSIVDKLQLASILTPYNQYELYTQGIYDLVLAGHLHDAHSVLNDDGFIQQVNDFRMMNNAERETSLVASKYMKINALLHLISPTPHLHQSDGVGMPAKQAQTASDVSSSMMPDEHGPESFINSICCAQHYKDLPLIRFPARRSISHQEAYFVTPDSHPKPTTNPHSRRQSSTLPKVNTTTSLPDLSTNAAASPDLTAFQAAPPFDLGDRQSNRLAVAQLPSRVNSSGEDALISTISSLLSNYLLSRQSTASSSCLPASIASKPSGPEFDRLLRGIKTLVDEKLAAAGDAHPQSTPSNTNLKTLPSTPMKSLSRHRRKQLFSFRTSSLQETSLDDFDEEHSVSATCKHRTDVPIKSQSCEELDLTSSLKKADPNENEVEF